jgi:hypothetical protein
MAPHYAQRKGKQEPSADIAGLGSLMQQFMFKQQIHERVQHVGFGATKRVGVSHAGQPPHSHRAVVLRQSR